MPGEENAYTSSRGALYVQKDGPNTKPEFIGCHDLDDIAEPQGAINLIRCFLEDGSGWRTIATTQEPPDPVTATITTPIFETADWLERVRCPATLFVNLSKCGRRDLFTNYERTFALNIAQITNKGLSQLVRREEDLEALQSFEFAATPPLLRMYSMTVARQSISETEAIMDIAFCNDPTCADECGVAQDPCEDGIAGAQANPTGSPTNTANVDYTVDGGIDGWPASTADPFASGEDVMSVVCFAVNPTTTRWLVAREADAANPMEIAYSDDGGTTWTLVEVGATNGQGANYGGALFALDFFHIWLVTDGGYIYFSEDGGVTWATQQAGVVTTNDLNAVWGASESNVMAVGDSDTVLFTSDGGDTWSAATATGGGNNPICVGWSFGFWWIGDDSGDLFYSNDDGTTWTQRTQFAGTGTGIIYDIQFSNELCGYLVHDDASSDGTIYRTRDGGYNWEALTTPANNGLRTLWICDCNMVYAAGRREGATAVMLRAIGSVHAA